jgi:PEP-CTERM motif
VVAADGTYSQHHLGFAPKLHDAQNRRLRLGTNSEFLVSDETPTFDNGVIDFDALVAGENSLGFIYGGIIANAPHVRSNPGALSSASNLVFEVVLIRVPEPTTLVMAAMFGIIGAFTWRRR